VNEIVDFRMAANELVRDSVVVMCDCLIKEYQHILGKRNKRNKRRWWVKSWIMRRNTLGASNTLLVEWTSEDRDMYKNYLRMSREQFFELLSKVKPYIEKQDTNMRQCISARVKLQITLRYLAAGDNFGSLEALYRVQRTTNSKFLPEVLNAIYLSLEDFIKVRNEYMFIIYQFFHNILNIKNILISILFPYFKIHNLTDSEVNMGIIIGKLMLVL